MAIDNEEQKEILLGNKQLLSIFFIVVVLLGVAFTIGYIIGTNRTPVHAGTTERPAVAQVEPPLSNTPAGSNTSGDAPTQKSEDPLPTKKAVVPKLPPTTHPAQSYAAEQPAAVTPPDPEPAPQAAETPAATATGTYLQVAALKREDADRIAKMLRTRGYPAKLGDSSKEGLFRVLVGPFKSMGDLSESKQKLKASGMDSFVVR